MALRTTVPAKQEPNSNAAARPAQRAPTAAWQSRGPQARLLQSQRTIGNQAVLRQLRAGQPQTPASNEPTAQPSSAHEEAGRSPPVRDLPVGKPASPPAARPAGAVTPLPREAPGVTRVQNAWYNFDIPFTDYQFDPSIEGIKTAAGVVKDTAVEAFDWIVDQIKSLVNAGIEWLQDKWHSIEDFATSALDAAVKSFGNIVAFFKNPLGFLTNALMSLDTRAIERAWAAFSGLISSVANGFKAMTDTLLGQVNKVWGGINSFATSLLSRVAGLTQGFLFSKLPDALQQIAFKVIDKLKAVWKAINDGWTRLYNKVKAWVDGAIAKVFGFVQKVLSFGINVVIAGIVQFGQIVLFLKDLFSNPGKYVEMLAQRSVQAFDGVESRFAGVIAQHVGSGAGARTAEPGPATTKVQRSPDPAAPARTSASWSDIGHGIGATMGKKWNEFKANPMAVVKQLLMDLIFPMVGNVTDIIELFKGIKKVVTGPLGASSLDEFWTSLLQILDIPIMIYHTVISILMRTLMVPLIVATFIPHPLVKGIAAAVGYALLGGFVQAETLNLAQKVLLLKTGKTTGTQKEEAYNRIADSLIALAMTAVIMIVMLILHFIANVMKGVYGFIKGKVFGIEPAPAEPAAPKATADPAEARPEAKVDAFEVIEGEKVVADKASADGHKVKITEKGRCLVCSTCEEIDVRYKDELKLESPQIDAIKEKLEAARKMENGPEKAEAVERVKQELDIERARIRASEPLAAKAKALETAKTEARTAIDEAKKALDAKEVRDLGSNDKLKPQINKLRGEAGALERNWLAKEDAIKGAADSAKDPGVAADADTAKASAEEVDALRGELEDLRSDAERIKRDAQRMVDENAQPAQAAITIQPDVPIVKQLEGTGQLGDLRRNPNLHGINLEELLAKTPNELEAMERAGTIESTTRRTIMKAFEGRNLGGGSIR